MKLYDYFRSTASMRVRIALHLKNISYEALPINLLHQDHHQEAYHAINPQELVPTLDEHGHIISQSLAIIEYLEEISPTPPLLPQTPLGRAHVRSLAMIIACDMHPLNNLRVLNQLRQQFNADEDAIHCWYHEWLKAGFDAYEAKLASMPHKTKFSYGQEVSLADICLIPQIYNAKRFHFPMDNYPLINEIEAHCLALPAFYKAMPN